MRHRFLVHALSHTLLVVDITKTGLPAEIYPKTGQNQDVPSIRFNGWKDGQRYFLALGADTEMIEKTFAQIQQTGVAVLTIV
jgi:hypothetical protein